jgi:hypothetical protein
VTVGDVSTQGLNSTGIDITGTGSIAIDSDTVSTAAPITDAVHLTGGTITGTLGNLTTDGTGSDGIVTNSTGNTTLTVGDISGLHNGGIAANLTTTGSGDLDFTAGNIAVGFGQGLNATVGGNSTITVDDVSSAFSGITVTSSTGSIDLTSGAVTANGWTAVSLSTAGAITYSGEDLDTQDADSIGLLISGGAGAIDVTVGDVSTQGLNSTGIDITGTGSIAIDSDTVSTAAPITDAVHLTGGTITGTLGKPDDRRHRLGRDRHQFHRQYDVTVGDISGLHNGGIAANLTTTGSGDLDFTAGNIASGFGQAIIASVGGDALVMTGAVTAGTGDAINVTSGGTIGVTTTGVVTATGAMESLRRQRPVRPRSPSAVPLRVPLMASTRRRPPAILPSTPTPMSPAPSQLVCSPPHSPAARRRLTLPPVKR